MAKKSVRPSFATLDPEKLTEICATLNGDGHGIYDETTLTALGVPSELIAPLVMNHRSDRRDVKATIFAPGGEVIDQMRGVRSLTLYETIASDLDLPGSDAYGRGTRAYACHRQILEWCKERMSGKPPVCHERDMTAVKNQQDEPIWWCPDCGKKIPRIADATRTD